VTTLLERPRGRRDPGSAGRAQLRIFEGIALNPLFRDWLARVVLRLAP
jgi:hypothetical protein